MANEPCEEARGEVNAALHEPGYAPPRASRCVRPLITAALHLSLFSAMAGAMLFVFLPSFWREMGWGVAVPLALVTLSVIGAVQSLRTLLRSSE